MRVAVVGAGICGLSAARRIAERGHDTTLFERFSFGHVLGSSHGRSRIVRRAYPDPYFTQIMQSGYPLWAELEAASGRKLLHECGLIYFGDSSAPAMTSMAQGLRDFGVRFDALEPAQAVRVMPALRLQAGELGIFTPEAGWVAADVALRATWSLAEGAGAKRVGGSPVDRDRLEREFDRYVVCAGSWISEFVPDLDVATTQRTVAYFRGALEGPVWIEDSPDNAYGFPSEPGANSFKVGVHERGTPVDRDHTDRAPDPATIEIAKDAARRRFGFDAPEVVESLGCLYTSTTDEDFRLGRIGEKGCFASACSGHGFKFGPWIGRTLADFVEEKDAPESYPRFAWPKA